MFIFERRRTKTNTLPNNAWNFTTPSASLYGVVHEPITNCNLCDAILQKFSQPCFISCIFISHTLETLYRLVAQKWLSFMYNYPAVRQSLCVVNEPMAWLPRLCEEGY